MKYRFYVFNDEITQIIEHDNSITHAGNEYDILICSIEDAKVNFALKGIDEQPIIDYEIENGL